MQAVATDRKTVETQDSQAGAEPRSNASAPARQRHVETARQRAIAREPKPRTPASPARPDSGAMLLVVLIRHGESQANATGADVLDPALTDVGAAQADAWRSRASTWPRLDAVLVSPLYRCVATAARARDAARHSNWCRVWIRRRVRTARERSRLRTPKIHGRGRGVAATRCSTRASVEFRALKRPTRGSGPVKPRPLAG